MDERELQRLFAHGFPAVVRMIGGSLRAHTDPEDLVQEALLRAWRRELNGDATDSLAAWVTTVAANVGRSGFRRDRTEERAIERLATNRAACHEQPELLAEAVASLPARQRDIVLLHYYGDIDVDTVSRLLAIAPGTVKSALHPARRSLRSALGGTDPRVPTAGRDQRKGESMKGWHMAGSHPGDYEHGSAPTEWEGYRVAFIESTVDNASGFGTLMQTFDAQRFLGKRVRLSGSVRTVDVDGWVGLWLRVDGPSGRSTAFDNMQDRSLTGSMDWTRPEVVLDVAPDSIAIAFGTILAGTGRAEVAHFVLDEVGTDVATTGRRKPDLPENMDFAAE